MNYVDTFIAVAEDCPASNGVVPPQKTTVAAIQYELMSVEPYVHSQEDVLFLTFVRRKGESLEALQAGETTMRAEFFAKPQPCLRTSPLARRYGWGIHFDLEGRAALCPIGSTEYLELAKRAAKTLRALRSTRR